MGLSVKELSKIIDLCRKKGVASIEIDNVKITLAESAPTKPRQAKAATKQSAAIDNTPDQIETDTLTPEELLFWSAGVVVDQSEETAS